MGDNMEGIWKDFPGKEFDLKKRKIVFTGKVKDAIDYFDALRIARERLFHMYCELQGYPDLSGGNVFRKVWYAKKNASGIPVIGGKSIDETLYEDYVWRIRDVPATDLVATLLYKSNNTSAFECGFFVKEILQLTADHTLVFNPSPFVISDTIEFNYKYAVPDMYYTKVYNDQFKCNRFIGYQDGIDNPFDSIIGTIYSQYDSDCFRELLNNVKVSAIFCIPVTVFCEVREELLAGLDQNGFVIDKLLVLDTALFEANPKKRIIIYSKKSGSINDEMVSAFSMRLIDGRMIIDEKSYQLTAEYIAVGKMTIKDIEAATNKRQVICRKKPLEYNFSKEIKLQYKFTERNGVKAAIASYKSYPDEHGKSKKILSDREKGLRFKSDMDLRLRLERVMLEDEVADIVSKDIRKAFADRLYELSIKSLWYINRKKMSNMDSYNEEIFREAFSGESAIGNMKCIDFVKGDTALYLEKLLTGKTTLEKADYIKQFHKLFSMLVQQKVIMFNPMTNMLKELYNRMEDEQYEVRNALTKKNLLIEEQIAMLKNTECAHIKTEIRLLHMLIVYFRLLTPVPVREMLALNWSDLCINDDYRFMQVSVTRLIERDNKSTIYGTQNDWKRFRIIPIAPEVAVRLSKWKNILLKKYGLTEEALANKPIFGEDYDRKEPKRLKYETVNRICRKAIDSINIEELEVTLPGDNELITDLNKYNSDLYLSNYKYHANHTCKMTKGEINYVMGNIADDTFSKHYCDFTNDAIQYGIYRKLCRWSVMLSERTPGFDIIDDEYSKQLIRKYDITCKTDNSGKMNIYLYSQLGMDIQIMVKEKDE